MAMMEMEIRTEMKIEARWEWMTAYKQNDEWKHTETKRKWKRKRKNMQPEQEQEWQWIDKRKITCAEMKIMSSERVDCLQLIRAHRHLSGLDDGIDG